MNVERVYAVATALAEDLEDTNTVQLMTTLRDALQNQAGNPAHPPFQAQVSKTLQELRAALKEAPSNSLAPAWNLAAEEMGALDVMGSRLLDEVDAVFARNQITPSIAHQEISAILTKLEKLQRALRDFIAACDNLGFDGEDLEPGQCELGVLLPRDLVKNKLDEFAKELGQLNRTLGPFAELATGTRPGYDIRSISSSDLTVFLDVAPKVAACLAVAVERVVALYKQLLEIKSLRQQLSKQGVSEPELQGVDSHANSVMSSGIDVLVNELLDKYAKGKEAGRVNELRTELTNALNTIANRLDRGVRIEIRVEPVDGGEDEDGEADAVDADDVQVALAASKGIQFLRPTGDPILTLPEAGGPEAPKKPETGRG